MQNQISKYLLISLILSLGFGQLLRFDLFGLPIFIHDIFIVVYLALSIPNLIENYKVRNLVIPFWLKMFVTGLIIGYLRALTLYPISSLFIPALYMIRILMYLVIYLSLKATKTKVPLGVYILSGVIALIIGLFQYTVIPDMRLFQFLGWDDHLNRLTLPHFDPSFTGVMFGLFALAFINIKYKYKTLVMLVSVLGIMLTYARSVWISLILMGIFFIKNKIYLIAVVGIMLLAVIALPNNFGEGNNLLRTYSISSRIKSDLGYIEKYSLEFIFGRGMNTLVLDQGESDRANHATGPNNSYLYLLLTTGVVGFAGWSMFIYTLFKSSMHKPMLAFFLIASLFNNVMFYPFALMWILLIEAMVPSEV